MRRDGERVYTGEGEVVTRGLGENGRYRKQARAGKRYDGSCVHTVFLLDRCRVKRREIQNGMALLFRVSLSMRHNLELTNNFCKQLLTGAVYEKERENTRYKVVF